MRVINRVIVHHSAGREDESVADLRRNHVQVLRFDDIGWHWIITRSGGMWHLEAGRPEQDVGAHDKGQNADSIGVCITGDYVSRPVDPPAWCVLVALCADLCRRHGLRAEGVQGHDEDEPEGEALFCPGFDVQQLRRDVASVLEAIDSAGRTV